MHSTSTRVLFRFFRYRPLASYDFFLVQYFYVNRGDRKQGGGEESSTFLLCLETKLPIMNPSS